jgi:hypothetical protein
MRRAIITIAAFAAIATSCVLQAQTTIAGNWQGTISAGPLPLRVGLVLTTGAGTYNGTLVVIDQDNAMLPLRQATLNGTALHLDIPGLGGTYEGTLSETGREIVGAFMQRGNATPVTFRRVAALDPPPTFGNQERMAVTTLVNDYFAAFSRKDYEALGNTETVPFTRWSLGGTPDVATTIEQVVKVSRTTRDGLDTTEYAATRPTGMIITPLSATSAFVDVHWTRIKKDDSLFQDGAEVLTVVKTPAGWRINGVITRALSHYGKTF